MSWKGFTKAMARLPHQIAKAAGTAGSGTVDEEYEAAEAAFGQLEELGKALADGARRLKDAQTQLLAHQQALAAAMEDALKGPDGNGDGALKGPDGDGGAPAAGAPALAAGMRGLRESLLEDARGLERLVVAPLGDFVALLQCARRAAAKRAHKLLDLDRRSEALARLRDRKAAPPAAVAAAESALAAASRDYAAVNELLKRELPLLVAARTDVLDPCLAALLLFQLRAHSLAVAALSAVSAPPTLAPSALSPSSLLASLAIPRRASSSPSDQDPSDSSSPARAHSIAGHSTHSPNINPSPPRSLSVAAPSLSPSSLPLQKLPPLPPPSVSLFAIANYDYVAQASDDLSFSCNDKIQIIERTQDSNDWWIGRLNGKVGQFPANYVSIIDP